MWVLKKNLLGLALVVGAIWPAFAVTVAPLTFEGVPAGDQQEYWESLMKYKLWGTHGIDVTLGKVSIADNDGYNGTADGDMKMFASNHHFGGPTLIGGDFIFNASISDSITMGPVRVLGNLQVNGQDGSNNVMQGNWCVQGTITEQYNNGSLNYWNSIVTGGVYNDGYSLSKKAGNYAACTDAIAPMVETSLKVPLWPEPASWANYDAITMTSNYPNETVFIHVPPDSVETNAYGTYDKYITNFTIGGSTGKVLYILMPPGGKLTRIYSKGGYNFSNSANDMKIIVAYVKPGLAFNKTTKKWDIAEPLSKEGYPDQPENGSSWVFSDYTKIQTLSNKEYAGNVLFYTQEDIDWTYWVDASFQGSWMTPGQITVGGNFKLAGQLLASNLKFQYNVTGDFRYVPFDPPLIGLSAAVAADLSEPEDMYTYKAEVLNISIDKTSKTDIAFKYCFSFPGQNVVTGDAVNGYVSSDYDVSPADVDMTNHSAEMPLCSEGQYGEAVIPAGSLKPRDDIKIWIYRDGIIEKNEGFTFRIDSLTGSVFKNNQRQYNVPMYITDADKVVGNHAPAATGYTAEVNENTSNVKICSKTNPSKCGVEASDEDGDPLTYDIVENNINDSFVIDADGNIILVKPLDYEEYSSIPLMILVSDDKGGSRRVLVTVNVIDVNEPPTAQPLTASIDENAPINTYVGKIIASDPETPYSAMTFSITGGNNAGNLSAPPFRIDGGRIYVDQYPIDYETKTKYELTIKVCDDGKPGTISGKKCVNTTATINIRNLNEPPVVTHDTCWIKENTTTFLDKSGKSKTCKVTGSDPEKGRVTYTLTSDMFKVSDGTITLKSNNKTPDFETASEYKLVVTIADSVRLSSSALALIKVINVDEKPIAKSCTGTITENPIINAPTGCRIEADDAEDGYEKLTYTITDGDDKNLFTIDGAGNISVNGEVTIDYDTMSPTYYTLKVKVSDTSGNDTTVTAIINVTDINEPPSYTDVACSIKENTEAFVEGANCKIVSEDQEKRALTFKIENGNVMDGSNPIFAINSTTGVITAKKAPDYESFTGTILYISIKDKDENGNFEHTVYAKATITVIDVNEPPTATVKNGTIDENSPVGTYVDCGSDDNGNAYYCVKGQDVDANTTLTYTIIGGDPEGTFMVNSVGDILVAKDIIDFETTSEYNLTIRVRDNGKPGELKDTLYVDKSVKITVNNGNERPSVTGIPDQVIDEHTDTATVVGTVTGTDPENGALTYHFNGGNDGQVFAIDSVTGIITVAKDIDFETLMAARADSVFKINVFTKDAEGLRSTETIVTIAIRDINEGAKIDDATMTVAENQPKGTTVGTLELYDQDTKNENRQNKFQIVGGDKDLFTIDANTGVIKTNAVFDYEAKTSYSLVVRVYDQDGNADTATVTINIADVKETSNIQVTYAETGSGAWSQTDPDSMLYINENSILLLWTADGKDMCEPQDSCWHENLHEGYNVITLTYTDPAKNKGVTETVVVFVSTRTPEVTVTTSANHDNGASIYTLVETPAEGDTSVYVNKKNNDIVITVKEPIIDETYSDSTCNYETHTFTVNTELEPVTIPSNTYSVMDKIVAAGPVLKQGSDLPPSAEVTYSQYNKDQVKVSYTENVAGVNVTISYVTDKDGNVEKIPVIGANGKIDSIEVITVSYQVNVGGKTVNVSYVADAATGQPLKTTTVNNSASNSGATANAGNSGSNGGANGSANGGSNSGANAGTNNGSNGGSGSGGNGGSGNANSGTGNAAPVYMYSLTEGEVLYSVTYDFKTKAKGVGETTVQVSYTVDQKGNVTKDKDGNVGYSVSYTYKNDWGNSSTQSVYIVVDLIPPKVKIMSPANDSVLHSNSVNVKWCVDFGDGRGCVEQDSLNVEGLQPGEVNEIVRLYRDKAGNEASDVVYVMAKNTKDVDISVEKPVTSITQEDVDKYYASKEPEKGQTFAISIYNPQTDKEIETQVGGSFKNKDAASEEVYPGLKGHLGPTLGIETKVPVINSVDGLATLDDLVGADGMILLDAVDAVGSKKVSVDEYVENYCLDEFKDNLGSDFSRANIYDTKMKAKIWVYTSLGQFVDYFSFTQDLNDPSYASDAGVLTLYFEMKPDKNGDLHTDNGRLYATGAYVYKTEITMDSRLLCDLPPFDDATNANKRKLRKKATEDLLKSFGYKRPKSGRK